MRRGHLLYSGLTECVHVHPSEYLSLFNFAPGVFPVALGKFLGAGLPVRGSSSRELATHGVNTEWFFATCHRNTGRIMQTLPLDYPTHFSPDPTLMLQTGQQLYGRRLRATDGDIGLVNDFYFSDHDWTIRYLVADTGDWLSGRQILISPTVLGILYPNSDALAVMLSRAQISNFPPVARHNSDSRRSDAEYYRYCDELTYSQGEGVRDLSRSPNSPALGGSPLNGNATPHGCHPVRADGQLRSMRAVEGHPLWVSEYRTGHVHDFIVDCGTWAIRELVARTWGEQSDGEVLVSVARGERGNYQESSLVP